MDDVTRIFGFGRFLDSDLSRDILDNMKESEQMYEWG